MDIQGMVKNLHPLEVRIIRHYTMQDELTIERVESELGFKSGNGNQALSWLASKGLVREVRRETHIFYELTDLGRQWKDQGTPEERMLKLLKTKTGLKLPEIASALGIENKDVGSAFGALSKAGLLTMDGAKQVMLTAAADILDNGLPASGEAAEKMSVLRRLLERAAAAEGSVLAETSLTEAERAVMAGVAKKRGASDAAFRIVERETVVFAFTEAHSELAKALEAAGITGDEIGSLTPEMLASGSWKGASFRSYNVKVPPSRLLVGRSNPYAKFLEDVKDKLVSLGFEEFDGSLVETEFWNSDALFMPQFHSARDIHDVYYVAEPTKAKFIEEPWLSRVAAAHENGGDTGSRGWNYTFDREFTRGLSSAARARCFLPGSSIPPRSPASILVLPAASVMTGSMQPIFRTFTRPKALFLEKR
jgi:phenylalanyl-tRNA synthetase alpha chain